MFRGIKHKIVSIIRQRKHVSDLSQVQSVNRSLGKRVYHLSNLVQISMQLNSVLDEQEIINKYLVNLFGLLGTKSVVILTSENSLDQFVPLHYRGISGDEARQLTINRSDPLFKTMKHLGNCVQLTAMPELVARSYFLQKAHALGALAVATLTHRDETLGLVSIGSKHNVAFFTEPEMEVFSVLSNFLAVAVGNARLYRRIERISMTDPLTGLFNRRFLENNLHKEVARAKRFQRDLSLVMLDVDHFKNYNDQLGHLSGDRLLRNLGRVLSTSIRTCDVAARFGGEEFCIILPEISSPGAISFSERLRQSVLEHPFSRKEVQPGGHISISVGTATYPGDAVKTEELLQKADVAMYEAKRNGRNRVAAFSRHADNSMANFSWQPR